MTTKFGKIRNSNHSALRNTAKRKEYGEYIRKGGEGKWKYRLKRIKLEAGRCTPELQDTATKETKWWCYADFHDEDLCKELGVEDLTGCTLDKQPSHGTWISKEDIGHL